MNENRLILGSLRYKTAIDVDYGINVLLQTTQKEVDEFDRNTTISLSQVFDNERQSSTTFRLSGNIDIILSNQYSGSTGLNDYKPFTNNLFYINQSNSFNTLFWSGYPQYNEFDLIRNDNNVLGYTIGNTTVKPHIYFTNKSATTYNWVQYITYPYDNNYTKRMEYYNTDNSVNSWMSGDGIPFTISNSFNSTGSRMISFICPSEHNLSVGEYVELNIVGWSGFNGIKTFQIYSVGNGGYNSDKYIFNLYNYGFTGNTFTNGMDGVFKRIIDINNSGETKSKYYVRRHKIISNVSDVVLTKSGFELNAFNIKRQYEYKSLTPDKTAKITQKEGSQSYLISFKKDIDISKYVDNLNRPITELFITIINKGYFGWMNRPMSFDYPNYPAIRQGFGFNISKELNPYWGASNSSVNSSGIPTNSYERLVGADKFTFYYNEDLSDGEIIDGDFCEFNEFEQKERVISNLFHKLTFNESLFKVGCRLDNNPFDFTCTSNNPPGYYYKPHNSIQLKVYSDYIEEGDMKSTVGIPNYAYYSNYHKKLRWRDIYTYGFVDGSGLGVDYPFLNGTHYPSSKIIFKVFPEGNTPDNISIITQPTIDNCE